MQKQIDFSIIESLLNEGVWYSHCVRCNTIYNNIRWETPLIDFREFGFTRIPIEFERKNYLLTSGLCDECFSTRNGGLQNDKKVYKKG